MAGIEREPQYHTALTQGGEVHLDQTTPSSAAIQGLQFFLAQTLIAIACVPYSLDLAILLIACLLHQLYQIGIVLGNETSVFRTVGYGLTEIAAKELD